MILASVEAMDLNRVDLNLLVAFDALMSEGSVTCAASDCTSASPR